MLSNFPVYIEAHSGGYMVIASVRLENSMDIEKNMPSVSVDETPLLR